MAITYDHKAVKQSSAVKGLIMHRITIAYAAETYATGGLAVDWSDSGLDDYFPGDDDNIVAVIHCGGGGYISEYDYTNSKLKVYYADYDAGADGALIEYPASALTATFTLCVIKS